MTDREFIVEIRHGLIIIMRACIKRYAMAWRDFLPSDVAAAFVTPDRNSPPLVAWPMVDMAPK